MVIEHLRTEVLIAIGLACAALGGAVGWLLHRLGEEARRRAHEASGREYVNAAHCARDRARSEMEEARDRFGRIKLEHDGCVERIEQLTAALSRTRARAEDGETALGAAQSELHARGRRIAALESELHDAKNARAAASHRGDALRKARDEAESIRQAHAVCADTIQHLRARVAELEQGLQDLQQAPRDGAPTWLLEAPRGERDDLKVIRGLGPALERDLNGLGIFHFDQLQQIDAADADWIEARIRVLPGAIQRYHWAEQARLLAKRALTKRKHA